MALIAHSWMKSSVPIFTNGERPFGGSGFLVFRRTSNTGGRLFLVTAKHVLCGKPSQEGSWPAPVNEISFFILNSIYALGAAVTDNAQIEETSTAITIKTEGRHRSHPDSTVDIAAIEITDLKAKYPHVSTRGVTYSYFATKNKLLDLDLTPGEDVHIAGYPEIKHRKDNNTPTPLIQHDTCFPVIKSGTIATRLGHPDRGFYVDCLITPGSSGSPVYSKRAFFANETNDPVNRQCWPVLLGMITNTEFVSTYLPNGNENTHLDAYAGLAWAYDADAVKETIEQFFL